MIRLKNVSKEYKSKKGQVTKALTNININFNNKGLVFIIGKSGSGKSTLLNIIGGLDSKTSGKIYIDNKGIDSFKEKDFDSYRNTYIGFIFQDFNLLEEYNVFDNVMLAAKLLRKKVDKEAILNLLARLDLKGLEYRNINELSGGQKQRVGIARALIKNPKIILADEPTGNLDSNSSKEIFKLLKEISKEKLVIVVSHDLENANTYADKILELQDGIIIRNDLNIEELEDNNTFTLTKAKLPFKECLHFALTSLKSNKVKLLFTIILTTISLLFMGISINSFLYDKGTFMASVMKDNNEYVFDIYKNKTNSYGGGDLTTPLNTLDEQTIRETTNTNLNPIYTLYDNSRDLTIQYGSNKNDNDKEFIRTPSSFKFIDVKDERIISDLVGKLPAKSNEIVIHKYVAEYIIKYGVKTSDSTIYKPNSLNELITSNKEIMLGNNPVIITGYINKDIADEDHINFYSYIYTNGFVDNAVLNTNQEEILTNYTHLYYKPNLDNIKESINVKLYNNEELLYQNKNTLDHNDVIISFNFLKEINEDYSKSLDAYLLSNSNRDYNTVLKEFTTNYLESTNYLNDLSLTLSININRDSYENKVNVIGISYDDNNYISANYLNSILSNNSNTFITGYRIYENNLNKLSNIINSYKTETRDNGEYYYLSLPHNVDLNAIDSTYKFLAKYINIVTLVFILFTVILFSNFIYISITYSKKQIGILRALGANKNDIIKIFLYESFIVGIISYIISIILWFITINLLNYSLFGDKTYLLKGIITNQLVPVLMFIYTFIISIIITIISLSKITKIKPIEAILNK